MKKWSTKKLAAMLSIAILAVPVAAHAGSSPIGANLVISSSIKAADGTTGQTLTTGSGVKTGHIQDGAITSAKIAAGQVGTAALADGAVTDAKIGGTISGSKLGIHAHNGGEIIDGTITDAKIAGPIDGAKLGAHAHNAADLVDGTVTGAKIADGAITDGKISGPITADKLSGVLSVDKLATFDGVAVVHKGPANGVNTFNTVVNAMMSGKPYVYVMPGVYDEDFSMDGPLGRYNQYNVQIVGASRKMAVLHNTGPDFMVRHNVKFRSLTIDGGAAPSMYAAFSNISIIDCDLNLYVNLYNAGENFHMENSTITTAGPYGITTNYSYFLSTMKIKDVTINLTGTTGSGLNLVGQNQPAGFWGNKIAVKNLVVNGGNEGVFTQNTTLTLEGARVTNAQIALTSGSIGDVIVNNSSLQGSNYSLSATGTVWVNNSTLNGKVRTMQYYSGNTASAYIGSSQVNGTIEPSGRTKVINSYDGAFDAIANGVY